MEADRLLSNNENPISDDGIFSFIGESLSTNQELLQPIIEEVSEVIGEKLTEDEKALNGITRGIKRKINGELSWQSEALEPILETLNGIIESSIAENNIKLSMIGSPYFDDPGITVSLESCTKIQFSPPTYWTNHYSAPPSSTVIPIGLIPYLKLAVEAWFFYDGQSDKWGIYYSEIPATYDQINKDINSVLGTEIDPSYLRFHVPADPLQFNYKSTDMFSTSAEDRAYLNSWKGFIFHSKLGEVTYGTNTVCGEEPVIIDTPTNGEIPVPNNGTFDTCGLQTFSTPIDYIAIVGPKPVFVGWMLAGYFYNQPNKPTNEAWLPCFILPQFDGYVNDPGGWGIINTWSMYWLQKSLHDLSSLAYGCELNKTGWSPTGGMYDDMDQNFVWRGIGGDSPSCCFGQTITTNGNGNGIIPTNGNGIIPTNGTRPKIDVSPTDDSLTGKCCPMPTELGLEFWAETPADEYRDRAIKWLNIPGWKQFKTIDELIDNFEALKEELGESETGLSAIEFFDLYDSQMTIYP